MPKKRQKINNRRLKKNAKKKNVQKTKKTKKNAPPTKNKKRPPQKHPNKFNYNLILIIKKPTPPNAKTPP